MAPFGVVALALVLSLQLVETRACDAPSTPTPSPGGSAGTPPPSDTFTTADGVRLRAETVASALEIPWSMAFAPDGRLFLTERPGRVRILDLRTATSELALTLDDVFAQGEAGLLGLALDPAFAANRLVYLYYSARLPTGGAANRIVRYREIGGRLGEPAVLLDRIPAATIHDGGRLRVGPDGLLYATTGDAANTSLAQDIASLAGKILRLTREGGTPVGNPFGSPVYSIGHRNPQGLDWHPVTGDLWASEHGNVGNDEINLIRPGADYGWPRIQGAATLPAMQTPVTFYNPSVAPSGASFYAGRAIPAFAGDLLVATLVGLDLRRLRLDPTPPGRVISDERLFNGRFGRIRDVVIGPDGLIYFCTNNRDGRGTPAAGDDRIVRLVPSA